MQAFTSLNKPVLKTRRATFMAAVLVGGSMLPLTAQAGWGDILKDVEAQATKQIESLTGADKGTDLSTDTLVKGLLEALKVGSARAIDSLSLEDGYFANPDVRIAPPRSLAMATELLRDYGLGQVADEFELSMNRAAEQAVPLAKKHVLNAIQAMRFDDAKAIYQGADDAATRYFEKTTRDALLADMKPLIRQTMDNANVTRYYQQLVDSAKQYPMVSSLDIDLENYVTNEALDGLFNQLAEEEKLIREDPVARTTELLKTVFGQ